MELLELWAGIGAQLVGENGPDPRIYLQRLGRAASVAQPSHEQIPQPFPQWVLSGKPTHFRHHVGRAAAQQVSLDPQLNRVKPQLFEATDFGGHQRSWTHVGEDTAPP